MHAYRKSPDAADQQRLATDAIDGRLAMLRLLAAQREYCGLDDPDVRTQLASAEADRAALALAPPGTHFVARHDDGHSDLIQVTDPDDTVLYSGPLTGYQNER